jgi:signal transduction histidine kinase
MRRLFWKIFGWFWGAMILIGLALYFVVLTTRPDPLPAAWRESTGAALTTTGSSAATAYERSGAGELQTLFDSAGRRARTRYWLFDANGQEVSGAPPLEDEGPRYRGGRGGPPDNTPPQRPQDGIFRAPRPPSAEQLEELRQHVLQGEGPLFRAAGPRVMAAAKVQSASGKTYVLGALLPSPNFGRPAADPRTQLIGGLATLLLSGLVCYGLVHYLTAPLLQLRDATQRLAEGDLSARTGAASQKRRDEVADLGRDFDAMAERIEVLVNAQRQLLGDISHELRSPLTRLSMALALTRRHVAQGASPEETNAALDRIARETGRLNALIQQLLELTRLESGEAETSEKIDLQQLVREVVADADFEARTNGRAVRFTDSAPCYVCGSRSLLHSAVENIVRNAVRYTAPQTAVEVSLLCDDENAIVRVRDYGPGVPEAALERLFEPFFRVEAARDRDSGGVGLGLAITQRAVRSHGGDVRAANAPGGGLQIAVRLPLAND